MFEVLTGPLMNLVGSGKPYGAGPLGPVVASAGADPAYPVGNLHDGKPAAPFRLAEITTGVYVAFANNRVANGDFEQGTTGWTAAGGATPTSETGSGNYHKGVRSIKVVTAAGGAGGAYQDVTVQAGEYLQLWAAGKSDGVNQMQVIVRCRDTNQDLSSAGLWSAYGTVAMQKTGATMTAFTPIAFRAPTFAEVGKSTVTLRVHVWGAAANQTFYADEVLVVPGLDSVGVFGHGFDASTGVALATSGADYWHAPAAAVAFGSADNAACKSPIVELINGSLIYDPYPLVYFYPGAALGGYPSQVAPWIGELVVGQRIALTQNPEYPVAIEHREPNVRFSSSGGTQWVLPRGLQPLRRVTLSFAYLTDADYAQARDVVYGMSRGGAYPLVLIPTETDPGLAIYGRLEDSTTFRRDSFSKRMAEFIVQEEALPWF